MNLELPFGEHDSALDEYLAEIDRALDTLFLSEVDGELARLRAEREDAPDPSGEAAA